MSAKDHQALVDLLREANETETTELAVQISENYSEVVREIASQSCTIRDLEERNARLQSQNDKFFLAATAKNREPDETAANGIPPVQSANSKQEDEDDGDDYLNGMFDSHGNLIFNKRKR